MNIRSGGGVMRMRMRMRMMDGGNVLSFNQRKCGDVSNDVSGIFMNE